MEKEISPLEKVDDFRWLIPRQGEMKVPGLIYANEKMVEKIRSDRSPLQVANVACLPGIVNYSLAMPDIHWGYGAPIGGVAGFDAKDGVIVPGIIGYDINCGIRLLRTNLKKEDIKGKLQELIDGLFYNIPSGVGSTGKLHLKREEVKNVLSKGARWAVENGYGKEEDLKFTEEEGCYKLANPDKLSPRAIERGQNQLGTLGAGNHFMEIQEVEEIYDREVASVFGLFPGQITVMIHTGSRGLGYQVCDDYLKILGEAAKKYRIEIPDRQLACAPVNSSEAQSYFAAMAAAANYAWANRQIIMHWSRETFKKVLGLEDSEIKLIYDVTHNIGKIEEHLVKGEKKEIYVHRKGATRAFAAGREEVPLPYRDVGQPVLIPGTMGTRSYVLVGTEKAMEETWGSTCHGAGREMSRHRAIREAKGRMIDKELKEKGIITKTKNRKALAEEAPFAYKNVDIVVDVVDKAGLSKKVAKMIPLGVIKG